MEVSSPEPARTQPKFEEEKQAQYNIADDFTPIKSLTTMNPDWIIRARVTKRG
jgi:hypothetical protein